MTGEPAPIAYQVHAREIAGTHDEKLAQIEDAIQELLAIKAVECDGAARGLRFLAVPRPAEPRVGDDHDDPRAADRPGAAGQDVARAAITPLRSDSRPTV